MNQSKLYFLLSIIGFAAPWFFLFNHFGSDQVSITLFFNSIFVNHVSCAVAADLMISALVFLVFVFVEGRRIRLKRLWAYVPATLFVGLSFGLPLFLGNRARAIERLERSATTRR